MLVYQRVYIYIYVLYIYIYSDIPFGILSGILFGILSDIYYDIINLAFSLTYILTFYIMEKMETTGFKRFSQVLTLGSTRSIGQIPLISTAVFLLEKNTELFAQTQWHHGDAEDSNEPAFQNMWSMHVNGEHHLNKEFTISIKCIQDSKGVYIYYIVSRPIRNNK